MGGCGKPQNLDDFAAVSRGISRAGPAEFGQIFRGKLWALAALQIITVVDSTVGSIYLPKGDKTFLRYVLIVCLVVSSVQVGC